MTNPPFGTDIKIEDPDVLAAYRDGVAKSWSRDKETGQVVAGANDVSAMAPEQLFIQRAVQWVKPGGRIGIVLPNGILSNPGPTDEGIRGWILRNCWVLASVELPVETFIHEAGVNILTSLLFLKKKTDKEIEAEVISRRQPDYPVFMAVAEKVGIDRRGNPVYKRRPDGEIILETDTRTSASSRPRRRAGRSPCRAGSRPSTTTCRRSPRRTRHSARNIRNLACDDDQPDRGAQLPLLPEARDRPGPLPRPRWRERRGQDHAA